MAANDGQHKNAAGLYIHDLFQYIGSTDHSGDGDFPGDGTNWLDTTTATAPAWKRWYAAGPYWITMATGALDASAIAEIARDALGAALQAGTGITVTPNDGADTITIATTITQYTDEMAQDALAAAFAAGTHTGLTITYTDGSNKFDFAVSSAFVTETAQDAIAAAFAAGTLTGITITYNDGSNSFDVTVTGGGAVTLDDLTDVDTSGVSDNDVLTYDLGTTTWKPAAPTGGGGYTDEQVRDVMGAALVAGPNFVVNVNDGADTITLTILNDLSGLTSITFAEETEPSDPASDTAILWLEDSNGISRLRYKDSTGRKLTLLRDHIALVKNTTGSTIGKGSAVYISGQASGVPLITKSKADDATTAYVAGIVVADIANNAFGLVHQRGVVTQQDTSGFSAGDVVYLSAATAGLLTATAPAYPNYTCEVGRVLTSNATTGTLWLEIKPRQRDDYYMIEVVLFGGGVVVPTGISADYYVGIKGTIIEGELLADQSGSIQVSIWKDTYANYPPTGADSIVASAPLAISSATKSKDTTLTGWTTALAVDDTLRFNVDSATTITRCTLSLRVKKT